MQEYNNYANKQLEKISKSQDKFNAKFDTKSYSSWFYDQESELLRLYNEDVNEIFFKYIPIGTYSPISNTWMWSWHNEGSIEEHKKETLKVKKFGKKHGFEFLTNGLIECEKSECWKLTAISKNLIGGIGAYSTDSKDLQKYFIIVKFYKDINSKEVQRMKQKKVDCGIHGYRRTAFVCQHLNLENPKGFEEAFEAVKGMDLEESEDFAAWCNECEEYRLSQNGWNEESEKFADIKLVCEECYFELKEFNEK